MKTIKLQGLTELKKKENLPEVPKLVQRYLDLKKYNAEGKHFCVVIESHSNINTGAGIAYSNELIIKKKDGDEWVEVYSTGMREYRGAYAHSVDNRDLSLNNPAIFKESKSEVTYALRTGEGNVKVYRFQKNYPENLVTFNTDDYEKTQKRIELIQKVIDDSESFRSYVEKSLGSRWHIAKKIGVWEDNCQIFDTNGKKLESSDHNKVVEKGEVVVLSAHHSDRDYDAITDEYQFYVWVKGKGIGNTSEFSTELRHPGGKFYYVGIGFSASLVSQGKNFARVNTEVSNKSQKWKATHNLRIEWICPEGTSAFETEASQLIDQTAQRHQHNHPLYKPTRITESIIEAKRKVAVWILFEQIDTDRCTADGEGYLGDQFRYSLWKKKNGQEAVQIYEDHAYIRPRSKSELTGTKGRDCTIKDLRIEDGIIKVSYPKGEKVEEQVWEDLTFNLTN